MVGKPKRHPDADVLEAGHHSGHQVRVEVYDDFTTRLQRGLNYDLLDSLVQAGQGLADDRRDAIGDPTAMPRMSGSELGDYVADAFQGIADVLREVVGGHGPYDTYPHLSTPLSLSATFSHHNIADCN